MKTRTNNTERNEEITWKITESHNRAYTYSRGTEIETLQSVFGLTDSTRAIIDSSVNHMKNDDQLNLHVYMNHHHQPIL